MSTSANLVFIGLPGSGKTTFLAALWHVLEDRSNTTLLKLTGLSVDRAYLNHISADWRACTPVQRTKLEPEESVVINLETGNNTPFNITVPDLSGEAFQQQLVDRKIAVSYNKSIQTATGFVLFVHPRVNTGTQLSYSQQLNAVLDSTHSRTASTEVPPMQSSIEPWSIEKLPTQVALVELLQFIFECTAKRIRVAVVISAWDLVQTNRFKGTPKEYLVRETPLLVQFLDANHDRIEHTVFGVSAQGGDITIDEQKNNLLNIDDALKRIKVLHGNEASQDITKPIAWLLEKK